MNPLIQLKKTAPVFFVASVCFVALKKSKLSALYRAGFPAVPL
jgi:hypothetical protein